MDTLRRRTPNLSSLSGLRSTCGRSFLRLQRGDKRKFLDRQQASRDLAPPPDSADRLGQGQAFMPYPCPTFRRWENDADVFHNSFLKNPLAQDVRSNLNSMQLVS